MARLGELTNEKDNLDKIDECLNKEAAMNKFISCDCSCADTCPQGKRGAESRCRIIKKESKMNEMTRKEAFDKLNKLNYDTKEGIEYNLAIFEALGLIKFKEEKKTIVTVCGVPLDIVIVALKANGYCVYKLGE